MPQDVTKVLLGATHSSDKVAVTAYASDPATYPAGTPVRLGSDGLLTVTKGSNKWIGVSLGRSLSDAKKTAVLRAGSAVPVLLTDDSAGYAYVVRGTNMSTDDATGLAAAAGSGVTASDAVYVSGVLTGVAEDGTSVQCALVDMIGGL